MNWYLLSMWTSGFCTMGAIYQFRSECHGWGITLIALGMVNLAFGLM